MWPCVLLAILACVAQCESTAAYQRQREEPIDLQLLLRNVSSSQDRFRDDLQQIKKTISDKLDQLQVDIQTMCGAQKIAVYRHCGDVYKKFSKDSGVYQIQPTDTTAPFSVYCDMTTDGGGWTVFQRRGDYYQGQLDYFYRNWQEYKHGFGDLQTEFWMGNDKLALMTKEDVYELRVDLADVDGSSVHAKYNGFKVEDENQRYRLTIGSYSGDAGDSFARQNGMEFTTKDRDHDTESTSNCAVKFMGAWWYAGCHNSNLNGLNLKGQHERWGQGIEWMAWKGDYYSIFQTEMKFRPKNF